MHRPEQIRAFIAINLSGELTARLEELQKSLAAQLPSHAVRWVPPPQIHLTLKFLGNMAAERVPDITAAMERACQSTPPFRLVAAGVNCLPNSRDPRVIYVGLAGEEIARLHELQARLEQEVLPLCEPADKKSFHPHLTMARVKAQARPVRKEVGSIIQSSPVGVLVGVLGTWSVDEVVLMRSVLAPQGSVYTKLSAIPLRR